MLQQLSHDLLDNLADDGQFPIVQSDDLPVGDGQTVDVRRAGRNGDLSHLNISHRLSHRRHVGLEIGLGIDGQQGRDPLRCRARRDHAHRFLAQLTGLLGRQNHIPVVGQKNNLRCRHTFDGLDQLLSTGIHRLTARYDYLDPQTPKDLGQSISHHNRNDAEFLRRREDHLRRYLVLHDKILVLGLHILNHHVAQ